MHNAHILLFFLSALLLNACGGSGDTTNDSAALDDQSKPLGNTNINPSLAGRLFSSEDNGYFDLKSGRFFALAPDDSDHSISPSKDGAQYVETIDNYRNLPGVLTGFNDAIIIRDMQTGLTLDKFELRESVIGTAKLSPNKQFVAAIWRNEDINEDFGEDKLTIFSRTGEVLFRTLQQDIYHFDWLADGRLIFSSIEDRSIYITDAPHSTDANLLISFSIAEGYPGWTRISPDQEKIAFELVTEFSPGPFSSWRHANIWTMNIDGSGIKQLATDNRDRPLINTPAWSPDNQWIATLQGDKSSISFVPDPIDTDAEYATVNGVAGAVFTVKSNGENTVIPADNEQVKPIFQLTSENKKRFLRTNYSSELTWLNASPTPSEDPGNLPISNQRHRGIIGNFYFTDDAANNVENTVVTHFDLSSSSINEEFIITDDDLDYVNDFTYISSDRQWVSHYYNDTFNPSLRIYSADGTLRRTFDLEPDNVEFIPKNRIQFAPSNHQLILFPYQYFNSGWIKSALVYNWESGTVIKAFHGGNYIGAEWLANGDVLLTSEINGGVYRSAQNNGVFSEPTLVFSLSDPISDIAVNPSGDRLVIIMAGAAWTINLDGTGLKRLTAHSQYYFAQPEWSPNGRYIAIKTIDSNDDRNDLGDLWVVAADAENIIIDYTFNSPNAIPLLENNGRQFNIFGTYSWR